MSPQQRGEYVLDADVLIQAHRMYYAFDICSGFWDALVLHQANATVMSIDKILEDIDRGEGVDDLKRWVRTGIPGTFFHTTNDLQVITRYREIVNWVNAQPFTQPAKAEFMTVSDGWLVAYAKTKNKIVVTQEILEPGIRKRIKIPNVCGAFGVQYRNTYDLLRALGVNLKV